MSPNTSSGSLRLASKLSLPCEVFSKVNCAALSKIPYTAKPVTLSEVAILITFLSATLYSVLKSLMSVIRSIEISSSTLGSTSSKVDGLASNTETNSTYLLITSLNPILNTLLRLITATILCLISTARTSGNL